MRRNILIAVGVVIVVALAAWLLLVPGTPRVPPLYSVNVAATLPHDDQAFTEGLLFQNGNFYESTGEIGTSGIRKVDPNTGEPLQQQDLTPPYFGEGIVAFKDKLYQVTWKDQAGFVYKLGDMSPSGTFSYTGEGWGLTHNDKQLILSDGTPTLRFLDPDTLKQVSTLTVTAGGCPVKNVNELEWVDGEIYANIWQTNLIARIDPATGKVKSFLDVGALGPHSDNPDAVPNGIAYDAAGKKLFVTGKLWPQLYQVTVGAEKPMDAAVATLTTCNH
jgi:glutaminyl-peptide cyclotransferase